MPDVHDQEIIARKLFPLIYIFDTSGSMKGAKITAANSAMRETMEVLKDVSKNNPSAELKIGVLQFASGAKWITEKDLVFMEDFYWNDLTAGGLTDLGSALQELDRKMSRSEFFKSEVGFKVPVLIFMSDGAPTDDYLTTLNKVNASNKWFKNATKIAIAVGADARVDVLARITGNIESVIRVDDLEALKKLIKVVSVTASMVGSKSRTDTNTAEEIINDVKDKMDDDLVDTSDTGKGGAGSDSGDKDKKKGAGTGEGKDTDKEKGGGSNGKSAGAGDDPWGNIKWD